jgi:MarR family transcriptional regulator for hemolysin
MVMEGIIDSLYVNRELHSELFIPICTKYKMTKTELLVLLFLSENSEYDTASHIVKELKIAKSHVSASVRDLEERGYLQGSYEGDNHRTIHLRLCSNAAEIISAASKAMDEYLSIIWRGFTEEEVKTLEKYIRRINDNANDYLIEQKRSLTAK